MRVVVQNDINRAHGNRGIRGRRTGARGALAALALAALVSGCTQPGSGKAVHPAQGAQPLHAPPARALDSYATKLRAAYAARVAAAKRWGLAKVPLQAPPAPAHKPEITARKGFEVDDQEELNLPRSSPPSPRNRRSSSSPSTTARRRTPRSCG